ncbi:hypothetical protein LMG9585_22800, partial [Xanthomonas oryzae pv. oryzae]
QAADPVATSGQALGLQAGAQSTAAIVAAAGLEGRLHRCRKYISAWSRSPSARRIHPRTTHPQQPAQPGGSGLLLPLLDHLLDHFSSRAKKADAFFNRL